MLVHEVHKRKSFERINQFSVLIRAEREVKNDISQSRMWWITKPARVCSCLTSGWCGRNRTDVSRIGIKTLQGFRQRGHVRSEAKLSPVMQKKKLLKAADCGDTFILNWFHIIFNSPFKKKKKDQLRLGCDVTHGAISPRVNRTEQWSPATWNERGAATLHSPPKVALSDDNIVIHRWQQMGVVRQKSCTRERDACIKYQQQLEVDFQIVGGLLTANGNAALRLLCRVSWIVSHYAVFHKLALIPTRPSA